MAWDKKSYDAEYYKKNIFCKRIPFNRSVPEDTELLEFASKQDTNFTAYIKGLIRQDMERQRKTEIPGPGYRDEEAIRQAVINKHRIIHVNIDHYRQVSIGIDDATGKRTILRVDDYRTFDEQAEQHKRT